MLPASISRCPLPLGHLLLESRSTCPRDTAANLTWQKHSSRDSRQGLQELPMKWKLCAFSPLVSLFSFCSEHFIGVNGEADFYSANCVSLSYRGRKQSFRGLAKARRTCSTCLIEFDMWCKRPEAQHRKTDHQLSSLGNSRLPFHPLPPRWPAKPAICHLPTQIKPTLTGFV